LAGERIVVDRLSVSYRSSGERLEALRDVSFKVYEGELVTIVGPSGCGKTTLLNVLAGLLAGRTDVEIHGRAWIYGEGGFGYVFQRDALLPWRTAIDNVALGLEVRGVSKERRRAIAREFLRAVGLEGYEDRYPAELSAGMRQRVAIARTLAYDPEVILMDEPLGALDAQTRVTLQDEILQIWRRTRKTILLVTHDIAEAVVLGSRVLVMSRRPGQIKNEYSVGLPPTRTSLSARFTPEFARLQQAIWEELRLEGVKARV
jgi:NitT/TauT family transport system ATP-binding protein